MYFIFEAGRLKNQVPKHEATARDPWGFWLTVKRKHSKLKAGVSVYSLTKLLRVTLQAFKKTWVR